MNKVFKYTVIGLILAIVCYIAYFIFAAVRYSHKIDWGTRAKEYLYFFKDSTQNRIDNDYNFSYVQRHDVYNHYIYNDIYYVTIWEFSHLKSANLNIIPIIRNADFSDVKINSGQTINLHSSPEITIKYGVEFDNTLNISLNNASKIDTSFQTKRYITFYGTVNRMLLSDGTGKPQVLFDYANERQYGLFLFYKGNDSFYLLIINSKQPFDPDKLINIFNLP